MPPALVPRLVAGQWVTGQWVAGQGRIPAEADYIDVVDPADVRRIVGRVPAMSASEVTELYDAAVKGARRWRETPMLARAQVLVGAAADLRRRQDEIVADLVAEMGKTRAEATVEVTKSADFFDYYASLARQPYGQLLADARPHTQTSVRNEPLGVVCLITPWNDPLLTPARKAAPALDRRQRRRVEAGVRDAAGGGAPRPFASRRGPSGGCARAGARPRRRDRGGAAGRPTAGRRVVHRQHGGRRGP